LSEKLLLRRLLRYNQRLQRTFSEGWVPPAGHLEAPVYAARGSLMVSMRREDKVLPASVIRDFVEMKVQEIEEPRSRRTPR
jgi:recombination associated protein RdgC